MLFETFCFRNLLLTKGKVHIAKMLFISKFQSPSFSAARSLKRMKNKGGSKLGFGDPLVHFEVEGRSKFLFGMCVTKQQVLPRVVCLCGTVGVCGECHGVK